MWESFLEYFETNMLACPWVTNLGLECPGCGLQRSVLLLLQGQLWASFQMYPALYPILGLLSFLPFQLKYRFPWGVRALTGLAYSTAALAIGNYILKFFP